MVATQRALGRGDAGAGGVDFVLQAVGDGVVAPGLDFETKLFYKQDPA